MKEQLRRIPNHGLGYGMLRYLGEQSEAADALGALPQAEVSFNYQGQFADEGDGEWRVEPFGLKRSPHALRRYLVEINGSVAAGALRFTFGYSENVHDRSTMQILADAFVEELHVLIEHCESRDRPAFTPSDFRLTGLNQRSWTVFSRSTSKSRTFILSPHCSRECYFTRFIPHILANTSFKR
jgi:non-ribosomal peptide synthase protein (TIGR01720 family)